jgi:hypothetical protein
MFINGFKSMKNSNQVPLNSLFYQSTMAGSFLGLIHYFFLSQNTDLFHSIMAIAVVSIFPLTLIRFLYKINPLQGKFSSPFKAKPWMLN